MKLTGKLVAVAFAAALLAGCAGPAKRDAGTNFMCALGGA
ncbi:hypothetical protein MDMS009_8, partial [Methylophaga thiooxydans DMS010]